MGAAGKIAGGIAQHVPVLGTAVGLATGKSVTESLIQGIPGGALALGAKRSMDGISTQLRRPGELAAEAAAQQGKALTDQLASQEKFAREQAEALKSAPRKIDDRGGFDEELKNRMRRFRSGFNANLKTTPLGLLGSASTASPTLRGTKLGS